MQTIDRPASLCGILIALALSHLRTLMKNVSFVVADDTWLPALVGRSSRRSRRCDRGAAAVRPMSPVVALTYVRIIDVLVRPLGMIRC
jgi:hypothetical protein